MNRIQIGLIQYESVLMYAVSCHRESHLLFEYNVTKAKNNNSRFEDPFGTELHLEWHVRLVTGAGRDKVQPTCAIGTNQAEFR